MRIMFQSELYQVDLASDGKHQVHRIQQQVGSMMEPTLTPVTFEMPEWEEVTKLAIRAEETGKPAPIELRCDPADKRAPKHSLENCCFCRRPTPYWFAPYDVPLCRECASLSTVDQIPTKREWLNGNRGEQDRALPQDWRPYYQPKGKRTRSTAS